MQQNISQTHLLQILGLDNGDKYDLLPNWHRSCYFGILFLKTPNKHLETHIEIGSLWSVIHLWVWYRYSCYDGRIRLYFTNCHEMSTKLLYAPCFLSSAYYTLKRPKIMVLHCSNLVALCPYMCIERSWSPILLV